MILFIGSLVSPSPSYCLYFLFRLRLNIWQSLNKDYLLSYLILPPNFQKERNEKVVFSTMEHHIPTKSLMPGSLCHLVYHYSQNTFQWQTFLIVLLKTHLNRQTNFFITAFHFHVEFQKQTCKCLSAQPTATAPLLHEMCKFYLFYYIVVRNFFINKAKDVLHYL